jgi:hypothetical protein
MQRTAPWYLWLYVIALSLLVVWWGAYMSVDYGSVDVCYGYVHSGESCPESGE